MSANNGDQDLVAGSVFGTTETKTSNAVIFTGATGVEVIEINASERLARIRLVQRPAFKEPSLVGTLLGGASGEYILVGKGIRRIPPDSPLIQILDQVVAYDSSAAIASVPPPNRGATRNTFDNCIFGQKPSADLADVSPTGGNALP